MENGEAALTRMCDGMAKVSAHYMIEEDGQIFQLVDEDKRAWHAGVASWKGERNINSASIGIEIVNGGHDYGLPEFPDVQIMAVIALTKDIMKRRDLPPSAVIGHSDIAPSRKDDPGERFPWAGLAAAGIGLWPEETTSDHRTLFAPNDRDRGIAIAQSGMAHMGYGIEVTGVMDALTIAVVTAIQRRCRSEKVDGIIDVQTLDIIRKLSELS
jgi:N-acetylmuramoyl-L-alanine amidase